MRLRFRSLKTQLSVRVADSFPLIFLLNDCFRAVSQCSHCATYTDSFPKGEGEAGLAPSLSFPLLPPPPLTPLVSSSSFFCFSAAFVISSLCSFHFDSLFYTTHQKVMCLFFFYLILLFCPPPVACGILGPQPRIEPLSPAVEAQSCNHWTPRETPNFVFYIRL